MTLLEFVRPKSVIIARAFARFGGGVARMQAADHPAAGFPGARRAGSMPRMFIPRLKVALAASALASGLALLVALGSEWWGGLVPCALCLLERWPYRVAGVLAVIGLFLPRAWARLAGILVLVCVLADAGLAAVHVGVEQAWWPSPLPECAAPRIPAGVPIAQRLAMLPARPSKSCADPTYLRPWFPLSFAQLNLLFALAFAASLATFLVRTRRSVA
jgi:disulfide bond formation protein DsbB